VRFTVADRDASASTAERLGATVLSSAETPWTREAVVRDPQGAELALSQFTPPG
jgi:predicted enzyme related to lactoylglutathione lyase